MLRAGEMNESIGGWVGVWKSELKILKEVCRGDWWGRIVIDNSFSLKRILPTDFISVDFMTKQKPKQKAMMSNWINNARMGGQSVSLLVSQTVCSI